MLITVVGRVGFCVFRVVCRLEESVGARLVVAAFPDRIEVCFVVVVVVWRGVVKVIVDLLIGVEGVLEP